MLEVIDSQQDQLRYNEMSWFARLKSLVYSESPTEKRKEMLKKSSKISLSYCLPDQVFLMYMNDLFFKQLELLLEKVTHTMTRLSSKFQYSSTNLKSNKQSIFSSKFGMAVLLYRTVVLDSLGWIYYKTYI